MICKKVKIYTHVLLPPCEEDFLGKLCEELCTHMLVDIMK